MIQQQTIGGRDATIAYLDSQFNPTDDKSATMVKVIFKDGEVLFLTAPPSYGLDDDSANAQVVGWNKHRARHRLAYGSQAAEPTDEVAAWNSHRERHRRPYSATRFAKAKPVTVAAPPKPRRSPAQEALHNFAHAISAAEVHRKTLKKRFGFDDKQIGMAARTIINRRRT